MLCRASSALMSHALLSSRCLGCSNSFHRGLDGRRWLWLTKKTGKSFRISTHLTIKKKEFPSAIPHPLVSVFFLGWPTRVCSSPRPRKWICLMTRCRTVYLLDTVCMVYVFNVHATACFNHGQFTQCTCHSMLQP